MPTAPARAVQPRKTPVQARSTVTVAAILDATLQVLVAIGKEQLTTTRVAQRAGVSVGTLYQYFPNKTALLQAVLERHLTSVAERVEEVCREHHGCPVQTMMPALIQTFFAIKLQDPRAGVALYAVSADLDGARISQLKGLRTRAAVAAMLRTAVPPIAGDPDLAAHVLQGAIGGISRSLLEERSPEKRVGPLQAEFTQFACAYLAQKVAG